MTDPGWSSRSDARRLERRTHPAATPAAAPRTRRAHRPRPAVVAVPALAAFFALFGGLALQMRQGGDPALGAGKPNAGKHKILVRRTVITREAPATESDQGSAPPASAPPAPAPAPAAPAPAPAPAPTVVTRQS